MQEEAKARCIEGMSRVRDLESEAKKELCHRVNNALVKYH